MPKTKIIQVLIASSLFCLIATSNAETLPSKPLNNTMLVPSGVLTPAPIISDATFSKIAKKNNLSEKQFNSEDLQKLDTKFNKVVNTLQKDHVFEKISQNSVVRVSSHVIFKNPVQGNESIGVIF